ncbi:MAG: sugar phosphate isomerase/epimerase [Actinobacteria bacterium]|nr:sugar phosphate isomerase/epimerase [Actinomycetota bacterium]
MPIRLGGHLFSFPACTVEEAARITRALGVDVMDLGNGRDLDPDYVAAHVEAEADRIRGIGERAGVRFYDAFPQATDKHITNTPDPAEYQHQREVYAAWMRFAKRAGLNGITLSPGKYWPALSAREAFVRGRDQLRYLAGVAAAEGVNLRIEPHVESVTWTPELALEMLHDVPGLSLTIDHSHFIFHGIPYEDIAVMHPYGTHWHARQAGLSRLQAGLDRGEIDFERLVTELVRDGYDGVIALEYVHTPWLDLIHQDVLRETVLLRDRLRAVLRAAKASGWA